MDRKLLALFFYQKEECYYLASSAFWSIHLESFKNSEFFGH